MSALDEMVDDVNWYQEHQPFHPLTCRHCDERDDLLLPIAEKRDHGIWIVCPTCEGVQELGDDLRSLVVGMVREAKKPDSFYARSRNMAP